MYQRGLFADWVPKWLVLPLNMLMLILLLGVSGTFSGQQSDIVSNLGAYTEHAQMANNAFAIGIALGLILMDPIRRRFKIRPIMITCFTSIALLVWVCGTTGSYITFIIANFLIGIFKIIPLITLITPIVLLISPKGNKQEFYPIFYPISLGLSNVVGYLISLLTFYYGITSVYYIYVCIMLFIAILLWFLTHDKYSSFPYPLYQIDWLSIILFAIGMMGFNYAIVFQKQQGWFNSPSIWLGLIIGIISCIIIYFRQKNARRKLIDFGVIAKHRSIKHGLLLFIFLGIYLISTSVFVEWNMTALGYNNLINAKLNLYSIPGIVLGAVLAGIGFKNKVNTKYFIWTGFFMYFLSNLMLYLIIQPSMNIEMLYFPKFLSGFGMGLLFVTAWFYATINLPAGKGYGPIAILVIGRNLIATGIASAIVNFLYYQFKLQSISDMSINYGINALPSISSKALPSLQLAATWAAGKKLLGWTLWAFIPLTFAILVHNYGTLNLRRAVYFRRLFKNEKIKNFYSKSIINANTK